MAKIRVAILMGGRSAEHEVSLQSAKNVFEALDKNKYEPVLIGIHKDGRWFELDQKKFLLKANDPKNVELNLSEFEVALPSGTKRRQLVALTPSHPSAKIDVVFPVLHGTFGEDGTVQGLLKMADIPFVGAGVLGSAVGMDKDVMKRLLRDANLPIGKFIVVKKHEKEKWSYKTLVQELGSPFFVKPANAGSSVGISKVKEAGEFNKALDYAFSYDHKILIEENISGREIECSVLGNEKAKASLPGEIVVKADFYSYEAKYLEADASYPEIPAKLPQEAIQEIQKLAIQAFHALECEGLARVDFFYQENGKIFINEINTLPGFTKISMYPKMWEVSGLKYSDLLDELIQLALQRYERESSLKTSFS